MRSLRLARIARVFVVLSVLALPLFFLTRVYTPAYAATSDNLNFQARLQSGAGSIAPDGTYNVQFKLYDASSGGTLLWTETRDYNGGSPDRRVRVANGYLTVNLGDVTSFPSTMPWDQQLYLTMNIGGTGTSSSWDGEMSPRLKLTAVPYAFNAKTASQLVTTSGALTSTLSIQAPTVGSQTFVIQDQGAAGTYNLLTAPSGSDGYVKLQGTTPGSQQTGNFNISGTGIAATLQGSTAVQTPLLDTATAVALNIGTTNATSINLNQSTVLAAGKSITVTGGNTASRPGSPTEGMVYYDTTTKQLLTYSNGKWQADSKTATFVVAASDSTQSDKDSAQYVANGEDSSGSGIGTLDGDQIEINAALTAAAAAKGGTVYLAPGTYTIDAPISIPNNVTLAGSGASTLIQLGNFGNTGTGVNAIVNTDTTTGTRVGVRDLRIDGRKSINQSGTERGISFTNMGGGGGASARDGAKIANVYIENMVSSGIYLSGSNNSTISGVTNVNNSYGFFLTGSSNNTITGNVEQGSSSEGIYLSASSNGNTVTGNTSQGNSGSGIYITSSNNNTVTGNTNQGNNTAGIYISGANGNVVSGNKIDDVGNTTNNNGIYVTNSDNNTVTGNDITDTSATTNNYAININDNTSDKNYLADNRFSSTPATASIRDQGTGTVYANQARTENGGQLTNRTANDAAAFTVQNASGTNILAIDTTNTKVLVGGAIDTTTATTLSIGTSTATAITIGQSGVTTTNAGALTVSQLLTGNLGATISGATTSINASSNFATNINTGTSTGAVSIGNSAAGAITLQTGSTIGLTGTTTITGLSAGAGTALTVNNSTSTGSIFVAQDNGSAVFTIADGGDITAAGNITIAANKYLALTGGNTASRPGSPTEGMVYYDTTTKQLLTYANGKWQADRKSATFIVAASDSSQADKDAADYVADGEDSSGSGIGALDGDQIQINAALDAAEAAKGGVVFLAAGTYTVDAAIQVPNNVTLAGTGASTLIQLGNFGAGVSLSVITNKDTSTGTRMVVQDVRIDGRRSVNTSGTQYGVYLNGMGAGTGSTARDGAKLTNLYISNMRSRGIHLNNSSNNVITGNTWQNNVSSGIRLDSSSNNNTITGNLSQGNATHGIYVINSSNNNTITGNTVQGNFTNGIRLESSSNGNVVNGNKIYDSGSSSSNNGIYVTGSDSNSIVGNDITDSACTNGTDCFAINISDNTSDYNYLADNHFSATAAVANIQDSGTGTVYANQARTENGGQLTNRTANDAAAFTVQNASGTNILAIDTSASKVLVGGAIDTTTATTLSIGTSTATAITIGQSGVTTTNAGALTVSQLLTGNLGATISGATTSINASSNFATNINTGTSTGAVSIGNSAAGAITLQSGSTIGLTGTTNINTTGTAATSIGNGTGTLALLGGNSSSWVVGTAGNTTTLNFTAPSGANTITFPASSGTVQLAPTSGSYIKQVPTATADNTITPATTGVVGLTVNGTNTGTAATALAVSQPGAAAGITIASANNTATNGISLSGTFTNLISATNFSVTNAGAVTAVGVNSGTGLLQGTGGLTLTGTTSINTSGANATNINTGTSTGAVSIGNSAAGAITLQTGSTIGLTGTTTITGLSAGAGTALTVNNSTSTGSIFVAQDNGSAVFTIADGGDITAAGNITIAANKYLALTGGNTASRPASPTEGMVYYDTTTKQLLTYANGKWQADSKEASFIVAASNSSQADKDGAQYVADGENSSGSGTGTIDGDQVQINNALTAASAAGGGTVYLAPGTYTIDANISVPNGVTLAGAGATTIVQLGNFGATATNVDMITNTDQTTGTNITVRDLKLDGRNDRNSNGGQHGIYILNMGDGTSGSTTARPGGIFMNLVITRMYREGILADTSGNNRFSNINIHDTGYYGISILSSHRNTIVGNQMNNLSSTGIRLNSSTNNTITGNTVQNSGGSAITLITSASNNVVSGNTTYSSGSAGIAISSSSNNTVTGNSSQLDDLYGINLNSADNNVIADNRIMDPGTGSNNAIYLTSSSYNNITGNRISDSSAGTTNYPINITDAPSTKNYLSDNYFSSTPGTSTIRNIGTDTTYSNQSTGENGTKIVNRTADDAAAFSIQNASGSAIFTTDTSGSQILATVGYVQSGTGANTLTGATLVKTDSTAAFEVQSSTANSVLKVDTTNGNIQSTGASTGHFAKFYLGGTIQDSDTSMNYAFRSQVNFTMNNNVTNVYGMVNIPKINSGSGNITSAYGSISRVDTGGSYSGTISNAYGFFADQLNVAGTNKVANYSGFYAQMPSVSSGNTGNTSGSISHHGLRVSGGDAAAGAGGTMSNYSAYLELSSGNSTGTANYGVYISGNGGATATNWALYSASSAASLLSGDLNVGTASTGKTIQGTAQTGANLDGAALTIKGAAGNGTGDGGNLVLAGGNAGGGSGSVMGLVSLSPTAFSSITAQTLGTSQTLTQSWVDSYSTIPLIASATGLTFTVPAPTISTVGRVLYVSNAGTNDFSLLLSGTSITLSLKANSTATLIWNGTGGSNGWTAAGASSSTDLQSAYNNTLTSAGGAELVLNGPGGAADGLTIRNNGTTPLSGGLLEIQTAIGTNLFSVNNLGTELAANGGAETSGTFSTNWTAGPVAGTPSRTTTSGQYMTGQAGVQAVTTTTQYSGIRNNLSGNPVVSTTYTVSFTAKLSSGTFTTLDVEYSYNGGTNLTPCTGYSTQTLSTSVWTKITCTITTPANAVTNPDLIIRQSDAGTARTFYIDNLSFIRNDSTTQPSNVQIGGGITGGQVTLFTFDRSSTAPLVANGDSSYLGSMYYDTTLGSLQCYEADGWGACGSAPDNIITLTPEYTGAVLNGTGVGTMTADFCGNGGGLSVNTGFCASGEARNYYKWTSPQATSQSYSIYIAYKLPSTFKSFVNGTTSLTGLVDSTSNAGVNYTIYRKASGGGLSSCSASKTVVGSGSGSINTWTTAAPTTDPSTCTSFVAGDTVIFQITLSAQSNAAAYSENLTFRYANN